MITVEDVRFVLKHGKHTWLNQPHGTNSAKRNVREEEALRQAIEALVLRELHAGLTAPARAGEET